MKNKFHKWILFRNIAMLICFAAVIAGCSHQAQYIHQVDFQFHIQQLQQKLENYDEDRDDYFWDWVYCREYLELLAHRQIKWDNYENVFILSSTLGHLDTVKWLLSEGADVNVKEIRHHNTALIFASQYGKIEVVKELLVAGADVDAREWYGFTALMWAASNGDIEIVKILLLAGADVNTRDVDKVLGKETALYWATSREHPEIVKLLLEAGADDEAKNSALGQAKNAEIINLLREAGATESKRSSD